MREDRARQGLCGDGAARSPRTALQVLNKRSMLYGSPAGFHLQLTV